jgi:hypothetical protein
MDDERPTPPVFGYVGRCRTCQAALAWRMDDQTRRNDVAEKVAQMIRSDLYVEYTRSESVDMARVLCGCARGGFLAHLDVIRPADG